jgi:hypothetical protein
VCFKLIKQQTNICHCDLVAQPAEIRHHKTLRTSAILAMLDFVRNFLMRTELFLTSNSFPLLNED